MADLTRANVVVLREWEIGDRTGKTQGKCVVANIVSGTAGGLTNKIVPAAFGLKSFYYCSNLGFDDGAEVRPAVVQSGLATSFITIGGLATNNLTRTPADVEFALGDQNRITVIGEA